MIFGVVVMVAKKKKKKTITTITIEKWLLLRRLLKKSTLDWLSLDFCWSLVTSPPLAPPFFDCWRWHAFLDAGQ